MVRTAIPGGRLTSDQLLAELDLCDEIGNTTLRITTRQGLQLHGVLKTNLKQAIRPHQRSAAHDAGRLRRREAQRDVLALPVQQRPSPRRRCRRWPTSSPNGSNRNPPPITKSGSPTAKPAKGSWSPASSNGAANGRVLPGDDPVEPIYGRTYLAAKIQNRHRPARRQQRRRLRQRRRPDRRLRGVESRRLQRARRRQLRRHAERQENLPGHCPADVLHRGRSRGRSDASRSSRCSAISATGPTARSPA